MTALPIECADYARVHAEHPDLTIIARVPKGEASRLGGGVIREHVLSRGRALLHLPDGRLEPCRVLLPDKNNKNKNKKKRVRLKSGEVHEVQASRLQNVFDLPVPANARTGDAVLYHLYLSDCRKFAHPTVLSVCPRPGCPMPFTSNNLQSRVVDCLGCKKPFRGKFSARKKTRPIVVVDTVYPDDDDTAIDVAVADCVYL